MVTPKFIGPGSVRYSTVRANNNKWILLEQPDGFIHLYTITGAFVKVLPKYLRSDTQVLFSPFDEDYVYSVEGTTVRKHSLILDSTIRVMEFVEYETLTSAHAEGDLVEGQMALCGIRRDGYIEAFLLNLATKGVSQKKLLVDSFDGLKAVTGRRLLVSETGGIWVYRELFSPYAVTPCNGHSCVARDKGRPALLWCSNARPAPWRNAVEMIDIDYPEVSQVRIDFGKQNYAMHISAGPDFAIVSVYDPTGELENQIWKVPFAPGLNELLYQWKSPYRGYISSPKATYSDGKVLFNVDNGYGIEVHMLDLPVTPTPEPEWERIDYSLTKDADYRIEMQIRGGKLTNVEMWKKSLTTSVN